MDGQTDTTKSFWINLADQMVHFKQRKQASQMLLFFTTSHEFARLKLSSTEASGSFLASRNLECQINQFEAKENITGVVLENLMSEHFNIYNILDYGDRLFKW